VTEDFLEWVCTRLAAEGKKALLLVWDNASWHVSQRVRSWIKAHNRRIKQEGGVRIIACYLPIKSPWLNAIEPCWVHGKRAILEPDRKLTAAEVRERVCQHFECEHFDPLRGLKAKSYPVSCRFQTRSPRSFSDAALPGDDPRPH
jgi:transposase